MRWWRFATHPAVVRAGGLWALFRRGRLAYRLLRDERVPTMAKLVLPAALLYVVSPLNLIPNLIPIVGEVDDIGILVLGVLAFIKLCPRHLVVEHEAALDGQPVADAGPIPRDEPVNARYRWVDEQPGR
ncbi:MAG TPA: DUF1232 domain-containing protein [Chloroflexota bacterium]|nr:DUF1232 domain-containing protein [Chloroflexota bacterium]